MAADHSKRTRCLLYCENLPEPAYDPWPVHAEQQLAELVCESSRRLPPGDQHILHLFLNGNGNRSTAIPHGTLRYRVHKVVRKLRAMNGEET